MLFTGEFYYHLDVKNRLVIPGKIRDGVDVTVDGQGWYLVPGFDGTISLYTPATFERMAGDRQAELFSLKSVRNYDRLHFALSAHVETDRLGRVLVPDIMLKRTGIGPDVAIVGVRDHLEIWDRAKWEQFVGSNFASHDEMAQDAFNTARQEGKQSSSS